MFSFKHFVIMCGTGWAPSTFLVGGSIASIVEVFSIPSSDHKTKHPEYARFVSLGLHIIVDKLRCPVAQRLEHALRRLKQMLCLYYLWNPSGCDGRFEKDWIIAWYRECIAHRSFKQFFDLFGLWIVVERRTESVCGRGMKSGL